MELMWEYELYYGFPYEAPFDYFHTMELDNYVAAFSFANDEDGKRFLAKVRSHKPRKAADTSSAIDSNSKTNAAV